MGHDAWMLSETHSIPITIAELTTTLLMIWNDLPLPQEFINKSNLIISQQTSYKPVLLQLVDILNAVLNTECS